MGWWNFVVGDADVVSTKVVMLGASGARIYNAGGKRTNRSVIEILKEYQVLPNLNGSTDAGAGPHEWAAYLKGWQHGHEDGAQTLPEVKRKTNVSLKVWWW